MNASLRIFLFLCVCIPVRLVIALLTSMLEAHGAACVPYFLVGVGFMWTAVHKPPRGLFGGDAWWANLRSFHAAVWLTAGVCVLLNVFYAASILLVVDVCVGGVAWSSTEHDEDALTEPML